MLKEQALFKAIIKMKLLQRVFLKIIIKHSSRGDYSQNLAIVRQRSVSLKTKTKYRCFVDIED